MKSWENLEADEDLILSTHMTKGRQGCKVDKIVLHHNGGNLTGRGCYDVWQTREASAHYQVAADGRITQLVWDTDTAWHSGDWNANLTSIGVEHADISTDPWSISEATLDNGAHLVAALCKHYGLGRPQWGVNVFPHSHFSATACPASIAGSQNAAYMSKAQAWYDRMTGAPTSAAQLTQSAAASSAANVLQGHVSCGRGRAQRARPSERFRQCGRHLFQRPDRQSGSLGHGRGRLHLGPLRGL